MARCSGIRADGGRCGAQAIRSSEYCVNHHPDYEDARRRRNSKGGKRGGRGRPQAELSDLKAQLQDLTRDVLAGDLETGRAAVANQLINTRLRTIEQERKIKETEDLEARIQALEDLQPAKSKGAHNRWR
jgi:hypothetical protein